MDLLMDFELDAALTPRVEQVTREPNAQARLRERIDRPAYKACGRPVLRAAASQCEAQCGVAKGALPAAKGDAFHFLAQMDPRTWNSGFTR